MTEEIDTDRDALVERVVAAALDVLAAGPLTLVELTDVLRERGVVEPAVEDGWRAEQTVDECLLHDGRFFDFADGRIAIVAQVLDGVTLTHRATADELDRGVLDVHPDLHALMWCVDEIPLAGADGVLTTEYPDDGRRFADGGSYLGPSGWLAGIEPGELVALRYRDAAIELLREVDPAGDPAATGRALGEAYERALAVGHGDVEIDLLVLEAAYADPSTFREATLPVGELLPLAGLRSRGSQIGRVGEPMRQRDARGRLGGIDQLRIRHRLDDCCVTELRRLVDTYLGWVAAGPSGRDEVASGWRVDRLFAAADHGSVSTAFADFLAETSTGARETMDEFARALAAAGGVLEPFAQHVLAVSALTDADAAGALAVLEPMLDAGTGFAPAIDLAAVLLADAGRPVDALAARRRATSLGWQPADTAALQSLLRQDTKTGRNEPCPCGSGRKYKQCCQREPKIGTADRRRLAVHQIVRHAVHGRGRDQLWSLAMIAMTEAMRPGDDPADVIGSVMLDPIMIDIATFQTDAAKSYLRERGGIIPPEERAWLERLVATPLALWSCDPDADGAYRARNVMTDDRLDGLRFPNADRGDAVPYVLGRIMSDGIDGAPGAVGPSLVVDRAQVPGLVELLDGFGQADDWAEWVGQRMGGVDALARAEPPINRAFFALADGGWDAARPMLDSLFAVDGDGWTQSIELGDKRLVRARLAADGDELVVATSSLRRLVAIHDLLEHHGLRILRSEVPDPDDDDDDEWYGSGDAWDEDWDDDDPDDDPGDPEALAAALRAVDAMFDRTGERPRPDAAPA